jgi:hypothetical protein
MIGTGVTVETYKAVDELRTTMWRVDEDVQKIKVSLAQQLPEVDRDEIFTLEVADTQENFQEFCIKLEDMNFRKLLVRMPNCFLNTVAFIL